MRVAKKRPLRLTLLGATGLLLSLAAATWAVAHWSIPSQGAHDGSQAQPFLGILVNKNLRVISVDWSSPAKRAGIQPGDVLRAISIIALPSSLTIQPPDTPLPSRPTTIVNTADLRSVFRELVPAWERTVSVTVDRGRARMAIPVLVTPQAFNDDPAHPQPTVTPVPQNLDSSLFYL